MFHHLKVTLVIQHAGLAVLYIHLSSLRSYGRLLLMKLPQLTSCGLWGKKAPPHMQRTMMDLRGEILNLLSSWIRCLGRVNEGINSVLDTLDLLSCVKLTSLRGYRWPTMCNLNPNTWKPSLLLWRNMKPAGCNALFEKKGRIRFALEGLLHL